MFGQIVIGPPGAGKTTYCRAMQQFMTGLGRKVAIVNLDPANDILPYTPAVDVSDLVTLSEVMDSDLHLGPNGGLVYCMEYLEQNLDWLRGRLDAMKGQSDDTKEQVGKGAPGGKGTYLLFDCPGQVELYTHHNSVRNIFAELGRWGYRLAAVHLADSHYCADPAKFVSVLLTSLTAMLQVELPHVNVLSKADLAQQYGKLPFNLDFFTDVLDLSYLLEHFNDDPLFKKYKKLNKALIGVIEDYGLVSFTPLHIEDKQSMLRVMRTVDKANGYTFGLSEEERSLSALMSCAVAAEFESEKLGLIHEKYIDEEASPMSPSSDCDMY